MVNIGDKISELSPLTGIDGSENIPVQKGNKNYRLPVSVLNGSVSLKIRKVYNSVSAMNEDGTSPVGSDGTPIKAGEIVSIYNSENSQDPDNNSIYSFQNPGWLQTGKLSQVDSELSETSTNPVENRVVNSINEKANVIQETYVRVFENKYNKDEYNEGFFYGSVTTKKEGRYYTSLPIELLAGNYCFTRLYNIYGSNAGYAKVCDEEGNVVSVIKEIDKDLDRDLSIVYLPKGKYIFDLGDSISKKDRFILTKCNSLKDIPSDYLLFGSRIQEDSISLSKKQNEEIEGKLSGYAKYINSVGKNLFDKNNIINGYYINSTRGMCIANDEAAISNFIPIEEGNVYHLERPLTTSSLASYSLRFVKDDMETPLKPLKENGEEYSSYEVGNNCTIKAPVGAAYCQFLLKFNNVSYNYDKIQLEIGNKFTEYEPYELRKIIDYPHLPEELKNVEERLDKLENSSNIESITIANSDKIGFFSDSFLNGYCMLGKHAINNLSMFSDYIMYNFGHSGDDILELLARIHKNEKWLGDVPVQDWGITYGVIAMQDNDGALFAASSDTYYENAKKMSESIKAMGGIPILSTEHDWNKYYYNFQRLSNEEGYIFMNWGALANRLYVGVFKPFWQNSHPATRTAWMWTYGMKPFFDSLPRPSKCIKIFRKRNFVDSSDLNSLMYNTIEERAERFIELTCGVFGLTEETEKYFDRLDNGLAEYQTYKDEYQMIQAKTQSVNLGNFSLLEIITPYTNKGLTYVVLKINAENVSKAYVRKINNISNMFSEKRFVAFGVESGEDKLSKGTEFNITGGVFNENLIGSYTVEGVVNGIVVTTTSSQGKTTSGTDNPECSIDGVILKGSYDYPSADYMNRYKKPLGEWVEVNVVDGAIDLLQYSIDCMDYDKFSILLEGNNILLNDISCDVAGNVLKQRDINNNICTIKNGESIIAKSTFNDEDTEWDGIAALSKYTPIKSSTGGADEYFPSGISTIRIMNNGDIVKQDFIGDLPDRVSEYPDNMPIIIKVTARYFPQYIDSDEKFIVSEIKRESYDCGKLLIQIGESKEDENPVTVAKINVGAWWNEFVVNTDFFYGKTIFVKSESDNIQICKVEANKFL